GKNRSIGAVQNAPSTRASENVYGKPFFLVRQKGKMLIFSFGCLSFDKTTLTIYSLNGKSVARHAVSLTGNQSALDLSGQLGRGTYVAVVSAPGIRVHQKLLLH
ncbi:MAG: hypothetical protein JW795_09455, partial [Chitinivibrionales bacterium]|nr:hypothetical protein [Chitinivibrionales bacterium]